MADRLPRILVTGASGFVGRHLLDAAKEDYFIYGLCRRSQKEAGVADHPNIRWIQADIGDWSALKEVLQRVKERGGVDHLLHLAAYYDFSYADHPEYEYTNINGTRHVLEQAKWLCVKQVVFASSLAACPFPPPGGVVTEETPTIADFAYARSKQVGEEMLKEYARWFRCATVRLAAVFSDWCEYPPLYVFLNTWLAKRWNSRILGGRGQSAVSYIHIHDLVQLLLRLFERCNSLPPYEVYNASPNGSVTHLNLFETATRYFFGCEVEPFFMPKALAYPGVIGRDLIGRLTGNRPFERPWMLKYIDRRLHIDSTHTRQVLGWEPTPRYHILRRLLFLIEHMKSSPGEWQVRNEAALKRGLDRPNLKLYNAMVETKESLVEKTVDYIRAPERVSSFPHYRAMKRADLKWYITIVYRLLMTAVRTRDRALLLQYADDISSRRFEEGVPPEEIREVLRAVKHITVSSLLENPDVRDLEQEIHDSVSLTMQLAVDEIEECFERFEAVHRRRARRVVQPAAASEQGLEKIIAQLDAFYEPPPEREPDADDGNTSGEG